MKVADVGAANEVIGNDGDTDVIGNINMGSNNNGGVTSENTSGHNGVVRDGTVNNNSSSENSPRSSRRIINRNNNHGMTSDNAAGYNNGAVREAAENDNSSQNSCQRNRERWFLDTEPGQRQICYRSKADSSGASFLCNLGPAKVENCSFFTSSAATASTYRTVDHTLPYAEKNSNATLSVRTRETSLYQ